MPGLCRPGARSEAQAGVGRFRLFRFGPGIPGVPRSVPVVPSALVTTILYRKLPKVNPQLLVPWYHPPRAG